MGAHFTHLFNFTFFSNLFLLYFVKIQIHHELERETMVLNPRHFEKHCTENNTEIWGFQGSLPLVLLVPQQWQE